MKIKIEVDIRPEEMRVLLGLPDISGMQDDVLRYLGGKMASGVDAVSDPAGLVKSVVPDALQPVAVSAQRKVWKAVAKYLETAEDVMAAAQDAVSTRKEKAPEPEEPNSESATAAPEAPATSTREETPTTESSVDAEPDSPESPEKPKPD